jgi:metal-sulfur cluster biosynthetic enzyme
VEMKVKRIHGVTDTLVEVVWDPPWNPSMMTEEARLELGL